MAKERVIRFEGLLQRTGWIMPAYVQLDGRGHVVRIVDDGHADHSVAGLAVPGLVNAHSHAFQYAMAGMGEIHHPDHMADSFWSWRQRMYKLAGVLDPDSMEAIACMLYAEMLGNGFTHVVEFHYLHHDPQGRPYADRAEMGACLLRAAKQVGIGITLVPVWYQQGGFGQEPTPEQVRFLSKDIDEYLDLVDASRQSCADVGHGRIGMGVHSLRSVDPQVIGQAVDACPIDRPFHLHIAEQPQEVAACQEHLGARPVQWLADEIGLRQNMHLVHATHVNDQEVAALARSSATVVLCPSTEGNLGDGLFPLCDFQDQGGTWSIGTDSHIGLSPWEELRLLDYGQRLTSHGRTTFATKERGDCGLEAVERSLVGGRAAAGITDQAYFANGRSFDAVVLDATAPLLQATPSSGLCSTIVYAAQASMQLGTMVAGEWVVERGRHQLMESLSRNFVGAMRRLGVRNTT